MTGWTESFQTAIDLAPQRQKQAEQRLEEAKERLAAATEDADKKKASADIKKAQQDIHAPDRHQARHPASDRPREGEEGDLRAGVEDARGSQPRPEPRGGDGVRAGARAAAAARTGDRAGRLLPPQPRHPRRRPRPRHRHACACDVHVITTSSGPGDDEVYVLASGAGGDHKTPVRGMGNGEAAHVRAAGEDRRRRDSKPISIKGFDEDSPSSDDLLVWLNWSPPFAPARNRESFEGSNYEVTLSSVR